MTSADPTSVPPAEMRTLSRALRLADLLARGDDDLSLSQLARAAGLPLSTASRLLGALLREGLAERTGERRYRAGAQLARIGLGALRRYPAHRLSAAHLERLVDATGETASLAVRVSDVEAMYLRQLRGPRAMRLDSWLGRPLPMDGTATGAALRDALGETGYVVRHHPERIGYTAVAAPVREPSGNVAAALTVAALTARVGDAEVRRIGRLVAAQAHAASIEIASLPA